MHSISNRNFEIHIFALLTFWRKFQDVTKKINPKKKDVDDEEVDVDADEQHA
jgi:hypothetical protein